MAHTKSSDIRYQVIDRCLRGERGASTELMMKRINRELEYRGFLPVTSPNTIRKDLNHIGANYQVEILTEKSGRNIRYRYADADMSIYKSALSDEDMIQLTQAMSLLERFEGLKQLDWLNGILDRLRLSVNIPAHRAPVVGFDDCSQLRGREYFSELMSAIWNRMVLRVEYRPYRSERIKVHIISPCYLKEYNRRWFLLGMTGHHTTPTVLAFDRIESVTPMPEEAYREAEGMDFNDGYFRDIVGVTRHWDMEPEDVTLLVSNDRLPYLLTKPIHHSQEIVEAGERVTLLRLHLIPNVELAQMLLSYGADVTVLESDALRQYMRDTLEAMKGNYDELEHLLASSDEVTDSDQFTEY